MLTGESTQPPSWRLPTRVAFRFFAIYFAIYVLTTQMLGGFLVVPTPAWLSTRLFNAQQHYMNDPIERVAAWTGAHIFHVEVPLTPSGSGDRMVNWMHAFCVLMVSIAGAALWSFLDRHRQRYDRAYRWFRVFMRFALGTTMISYGFAKAFPLQMPAPFLTRLLEPYGNFSPMGVLWYSIGASFPYERFVGCVEVLSGALLFFPRTQLAGVLLTIGATIEVFMLNMTYDVPVKLFSFHLVVMSLVLLAPYAKRICGVVFDVRGRSAWATAFQVLLGLWMLWGGYQSGVAGWALRGPSALKPPLYGIWRIDRMTIDGVERAPLVTDYERWRRVVVQTAAGISFWRMDDTVLSYGAKVDASAKTIALTTGTNAVGQLTFNQVAADRLVFDGTIEQHKVHMETALVDHTKFLLLTRGFHWVQEAPFNK